MKELLFFWISFHIGSGFGYDKILNFDKSGCGFDFYYLSQYQSYLVTWNGTMRYLACEAYFRGRNFDNVETTFRVCFKTLDYHFSRRCETKIKFIDGLDTESGDEFNCTSKVPSIWCTKESDYAHLKINVDYDDPGSRLKLEVTVTADVSLSIGAAVGIAFGCAGFIGIMVTLLIVFMIRKHQKKPSVGRVISTQSGVEGDPSTGVQQQEGFPMVTTANNNMPINR